MSKDTKLQVPISSSMKSILVKKAIEAGFSNVNEYVRVMLHNIIQNDLSLAFVDSHKAAIEFMDEETEKRVAESMEAYKRGEYDIIDFSKDRDALRKILNESEDSTDGTL